MVTNSGATRCVTNIRFALNELRELGLVYNEESIENELKRVVLPTPLGYLIALHVMAIKQGEQNQYLAPENVNRGYNKLLYHSIFRLRNSMNEFMKQIINKYPDVEPLDELVGKILAGYYDLVLPNIDIAGDRLIIREKEMKISIVEFYKLLRNHVGLSYKLKEIFLRCNIKR